MEVHKKTDNEDDEFGGRITTTTLTSSSSSSSPPLLSSSHHHPLLQRQESRDSNQSFQTSNPPYLLLLGEAGSLCCAKLGFFDTFDELDNPLLVEGNAFDVIVFQSADHRLFQNSDFLVTFEGVKPPPQQRSSSSSNKYKNNNSNNGGPGSSSSSSSRKTVLEIRRGESTVWIPIERLKNHRTSTTSHDDVDDDDFEDESSSTINNNRYKNKNKNDTNSSRWDDSPPPSCVCCRPIHQRVAPFPPGRTVDDTTVLHPSSSGGEKKEDCEISGRLAEFLVPGRNPIRYLLLDEDDNNKIIGVARANIYLWSYQDKIVISDIDGTITKSNARGVVDTLLTEKFQYCHEGVCQLLTHLKNDKPNVQVAYLTSRPIALATATRRFLENMTQKQQQQQQQQEEQGSTNNYYLPPGPLLGFGGTFSELLKMELLSQTTHHFKSGVLLRQIVKPYQHATTTPAAAAAAAASTGSSSSVSPPSLPPPSKSLFVAGFGNSWMDVQAYHMAGMNLNTIFLINKRSHICTFDKMTLDNNKWITTSTTTTTIGSDGIPIQEINSKEEESSPLKIDIPMSREWYQSQMGTKFHGYTDVALASHVWDDEIEESLSLN